MGPFANKRPLDIGFVLFDRIQDLSNTKRLTVLQSLPRHESLLGTPTIALGIADWIWTIGDVLDAAFAAEPPKPTPTAPHRRRQFRVIEGGRK